MDIDIYRLTIFRHSTNACTSLWLPDCHLYKLMISGLHLSLYQLSDLEAVIALLGSSTGKHSMPCFITGVVYPLLNGMQLHVKLEAITVALLFVRIIRSIEAISKSL